MLEAKNVTFSYDGVRPVLDSVNLTLQRGEIVVLTGPTGSGKSTLAKFLCGFIPRVIGGECSGALSIDGADAESLPMAEIARKVALVQQDPDSQICTLTVADEIAFGPENYLVESGTIVRLVDSSLASIGSSDLAARLTYALSGGEKQRIVIASMLACQPDYLILDEPSSSLDQRGILQLRQILVEMKERNLGILCIEHNLRAFLPVADRVLVLSQGRLSPWTAEEGQKKVQPLSHSVSSSETEVIASLDGVSFAYADTPVIRRITMAIHRGEVLALMGDNGSGKTTLLGLLGGLLNPSEGDVRLRGDPLRRLSKKEVARRVAVVFQNPNSQIFERTVSREYVLTLDVLGLTDRSSSEHNENRLGEAGLAELKDRNPFSLSHGQKRRLNVCSAIVHDPELYLFDEPFTGQDRAGWRFIIDTISARAQAGGACVVATHNLSFAAEYCSRVVFLEKGSLLLDGRPESVLRRLEQIGRNEYKLEEVGS
jgi:energy-coupling factor transporter ATP-binding protein EcfA2